MYQDELYQNPINAMDKPELTDENEQPISDSEQTAMPEEIEETEELLIGIVSNCNRLNVREKASKDAAIVCEVACETKVMIALNESTEDFYKVCTAAGIEGFCMKQFITIQP